MTASRAGLGPPRAAAHRSVAASRGAAALASLLLLLAACGGSTANPTTANPTTANPNTGNPTTASTTGGTPAATGGSAEAEIRHSYETFFAGTTPASGKIALLQDGDRFAEVIKAQADQPIARQTSVRVTDVHLTGPDQATVTYDILVGGQPALSGRTGTARLVDGTWKVATDSFCQLLGLAGPAPPPCPASSASASPGG